jgi:hypothetical protein
MGAGATSSALLWPAKAGGEPAAAFALDRIRTGAL